MKEEGKLRAIGITEGFLSDPHHKMLRAAVEDEGLDVVMARLQPRQSQRRWDRASGRQACKGVGTIGMFALRDCSIAAG